MWYRAVSCGMSAAAAFALHVPAEAQNDELQVVAGRTWSKASPWLWIAEPKHDGYYAVRIRIGDLDPATASGERQLRRRVFNSIDRACWVLSSSRNAVSEEECLGELRRKINSRVASVIANAQNGTRTAFLELGSPKFAKPTAVAG